MAFTSLTNANDAVAGSTGDLGSDKGLHTMIVVATGSINSATVALEVSHDNSTFKSLSGAWNYGDSSGGVKTFSVVARYVRARITVVDGSSPSITVTIASA